MAGKSHLQSWVPLGEIFAGIHDVKIVDIDWLNKDGMFFETEDVAKKLNYHVEHVRRMMREGSIKGIKVGRTWLVQRKSVEDYLKRTTQMSKHDPRRTQEKARPV